MGSAGGGGKKRKRNREKDRERERERSRKRKAARAAAAAAEKLEVQEDVWAQCERCDKWRRLPPGTEIDEERPWYCTMNPNKSQNRCDVAEEEYSDVYVEPDVAVEVTENKHMNGGLAASGGNVSAGKPPSGKSKAGKGKKPGRKHPRQLGPTILGQHQKVLTVGLGNAAGWVAGQSSGPAAARITLDLWRSLHMVTPTLGAAASTAANEASAAAYFGAEAPDGAALSASAAEFARVAITASSAVAKGLSDRYMAEIRPTAGPGKPPLAVPPAAVNGPQMPASPSNTSAPPTVSPPPVAAATPGAAPSSSVAAAAAVVSLSQHGGQLGSGLPMPGTMPTPGFAMPSAGPSPLGPSPLGPSTMPTPGATTTTQPAGTMPNPTTAMNPVTSLPVPPPPSIPSTMPTPGFLASMPTPTPVPVAAPPTMPTPLLPHPTEEATSAGVEQSQGLAGTGGGAVQDVLDSVGQTTKAAAPESSTHKHLPHPTTHPPG